MLMLKVGAFWCEEHALDFYVCLPFLPLDLLPILDLPMTAWRHACVLMFDKFVDSLTFHWWHCHAAAYH